MSYKSNWKDFFGIKKNVLWFFGVILLLIITLSLFSRFLIFIEGRNGFSYEDPFLKFFDAIELNILIFGLIYFSLVSGLIYLSRSPQDFIIAIAAYILLVWFRTIMMYSIPLDPPVGTINLKDPLVFIIGTGRPVTKDLFFSGHTSTLFLIFLAVNNKMLKTIYLSATIIVGLSVMLQKAHYSVDVFAAPFVAYSVYKISVFIFMIIFPEYKKPETDFS